MRTINLRRRAGQCLVITSLVLVPQPANAAPQRAAGADQKLPPLSYVCPMAADAQVLEE